MVMYYVFIYYYYMHTTNPYTNIIILVHRTRTMLQCRRAHGPCIIFFEKKNIDEIRLIYLQCLQFSICGFLCLLNRYFWYEIRSIKNE